MEKLGKRQQLEIAYVLGKLTRMDPEALGRVTTAIYPNAMVSEETYRTGLIFIRMVTMLRNNLDVANWIADKLTEFAREL